MDFGVIVLGLVVLLIYIALFAYLIANYVLESLAFYKIAKAKEIENPWLSWIPVCNYYIIGRIANEYDKEKGYDRKWHKPLLTFGIIFAAVMSVGYVVFIAGSVIMSMDYGYMDYSSTLGVSLFAIGYAGILVGAVAAAVTNILSGICVYKIFEALNPEKAIKYIILYFLVPLAGPICLLKNSDRAYPEKVETPEVTEESEDPEDN